MTIDWTQILIVCIGLIGAGVPTSFYFKSEKKRRAVEIKLTETTAELQESQTAAADIDSFAKKITVYETAIKSVEDQYNKLFKKVDIYEKKIETLQASHDKLKEENKVLRDINLRLREINTEVKKDYKNLKRGYNTLFKKYQLLNEKVS